jgi:hypothetical protein
LRTFGIRMDRGHDRARAVLLPFLAPGAMLAVPEVAETNDETGNRFRQQRHVRSFQFAVEMRGFVRDLGAAHRLNPFLR